MYESCVIELLEYNITFGSRKKDFRQDRSELTFLKTQITPHASLPGDKVVEAPRLSTSES